MRFIFRSPSELIDQIRNDLHRRHEFAHERVGFVTVGAAKARDTIVLLAQNYFPVDDADYLPDRTVEAMINQDAIRKALNLALLNKVGIVHVHMHDFEGPAFFSRVDIVEQNKLIPDFFKVRSEMPHGALVLSPDSAIGRVWTSPVQAQPVAEFNFTGPRLQFIFTDSIS